MGSSLESRHGWTYHVTTPLNGYVTAQIWVNTLGGNHHLAATPKTLYNLDVPATPRVVHVDSDHGRSGRWRPSTSTCSSRARATSCR